MTLGLRPNFSSKAATDCVLDTAEAVEAFSELKNLRLDVPMIDSLLRR
jgi:hypothetical protein